MHLAARMGHARGPCEKTGAMLGSGDQDQFDAVKALETSDFHCYLLIGGFEHLDYFP